MVLEYVISIAILFFCYGTIAHVLLFAWYSKRIGGPFDMLDNSKYWHEVEKKSAFWIALCLTILTIFFKWSLL